MIVCLCHRVSDRNLQRAVREGVSCFEQLQDETRVASSCGCCHDCASCSCCARARAATGQFDAAKAVFEIDDGPHHDHLVCVRCGAVQEFADETIEQHQQPVAEARGFALAEHRLALFGVCAGCRG